MNPLTNHVILFADGASSGNPGPGGWGTIVVYLAGDSQEIQELGGAEARTTNNRMELTGVIEGLEFLLARKLDARGLRVCSDSTYVLRGITQWIHAWKRKGWKNAEGGAVLNRDLWEELDLRVSKLRAMGWQFEWDYVPGHSGVPGNERVDEIAVQFSRGSAPELYHGPLSGYAISVLEVSAKTAAPKTSAGGKAYYLSLVDGAVEKHATWAECEARVKGKSGARYKKVSSPEEERATLQGWRAS